MGSQPDRQLELRIAPLDEHQVIVAIRDVTEQHRLQAELVQSQKMEAVGRLASSVAHDFNNLLTVILCNIELLMLSTDEADAAFPMLHEVVETTTRASTLTRQLLTFSRKEYARTRVIDMVPVVANLAKLVARIAGESVSAEVVSRVESAHILIDPGHLEQVVMNLAVNARDAMAQGGDLWVETDVVEADSVLCIASRQRFSGRYAVVRVRDTGEGIPLKIISHLFEPFFTTKPSDKGTGLGYFPLAEGEVARPPGPGEKKMAEGVAEELGGQETLLIIENDTSVRQSMHEALVHYGYRVLEARSGYEAIGIYDQIQKGIDLIVTDLVMPGMTGAEVIDVLTAKYPGTFRVIFMSGYPDDTIQEVADKRRIEFFLEKPFTPMELARRIRIALDAKNGHEGAA